MTTPMNKVIQHIRRVALLQAAGQRTDGQLLESFVRCREEAALEVLVRRHGPMVWGVCRRTLHSHHDAEDAFQATFLVLVRKASTVKPREMVGNWLYGVAHQTALKARATMAKRRTRERQVADMPEPAATEPGLWRDLQPVLDQELSRLPDKYRVAIVLCDLEGKTRKEAARQLGCPEGTVAGRLARARIMLAKRLTRRGVALSGGALAAVLCQQAASAGVPASVVVSTIKAATLLAAGKAAATGAISLKVAALTEGVMKAMLFTKLKTVLAVMLILGFTAAGATVLTSRTAAGQEDKQPLAEKPVATSAKQEPEKKEEEFAWGKEVNGLQLGLAFAPADKIVYRPGEEIQCEVRVRNVSKAPITISNMIDASEPEITDAKGEKVHVAMPPLNLFIVIPNEQVLKPGETVALYPRKVAVERVPEGKADPNALFGTPTIRVPAGKYKIGISEFVQSKLKLSTGIVEFEVTDKNAKESPEKKEGFTAWGKEVNGLQLGLALVPADKIAYRPGEEIQCEVRVRNVSKAPITISYMFDESEPEITDAKGEKVHVAMPPFSDYTVIPTEEVLKPGETVALYPRKVAVERVPEGKADPNALFGTPTIRVPAGKYKIGLSEFVQSKLKLSTGSVEFEVTDKNSKAKDGARTSLSDAIKALNTKASHDDVGKDETPITEPEVIAAIRAAKRPEDSAVTDKLFDAFKKIAETKQLPPGAELEAVGGPWDPGGSFVYDVWWVRLRMPKEANGTYGFVIRERIIRSRTLQEEVARLEKKRPGEGELPVVDGGRLQEIIKNLKTRIAKMKAK
jgi:RNA polymerase sigma factor (sigma-70 family)